MTERLKKRKLQWNLQRWNKGKFVFSPKENLDNPIFVVKMPSLDDKGEVVIKNKFSESNIILFFGNALGA